MSAKKLKPGQVVLIGTMGGPQRALIVNGVEYRGRVLVQKMYQAHPSDDWTLGRAIRWPVADIQPRRWSDG